MDPWTAATGVVFDLDDTLIDWRAAERDAISAVAAAHLDGITPDRVHAAYAEVKLENFASFRATGRWWLVDDRLLRLRQHLGRSADGVDLMVETFRSEVRRRLRLVPGAPEVMAHARSGRRTAILTNGPAQVQRPKVDGLGLADHVDAVCIAGEMDLWKPDPGAFRETLRRLGVAPRHAVMVGDSWELDIAPARALGMRTVWIGGDDAAAADVVVPDVTALAHRLGLDTVSRP